jgi:hypothetical protein
VEEEWRIFINSKSDRHRTLCACSLVSLAAGSDLRGGGGRQRDRERVEPRDQIKS